MSCSDASVASSPPSLACPPPAVTKRFGVAGCRALSEALHHNTTLVSLDIRCRCFDVGVGFVQSAEAPGPALPCCDCVRADNNISAVGCESLSGALRVNSTLTSLDVGGCECDCKCATRVELLTLCAAMASVVLCCVVYRVACVVGCCDCVRAGNDIGAAGCESLSGALRVNSTLTSLDVSGEWDCDCATLC